MSGDQLPVARAAAAALFADGVARTLDAAAMALAGVLGGDAEEREDRLLAILDEDERYHLLPDERFVDARALLEGRRFTHRLTPEEVAAGAVAVLPDLAALLAPAGAVVPLAEGGEASLAGLEPDAGGWRADDERLCGPAGWLGGAGAGDLVALGWAGGRVAVAAAVDDPAASARVAEALADALRAAVWRPDDGALLDDVVLSALLDDPDLLTRPAAPLDELLGAAGLSRRGEWVGDATRDWLDPVARAREKRRSLLDDAYGFSACCHDALRAVDRALLAHLTDEPGAAAAPEAVAAALLHGEVAEAFGRELLGVGGHEGRAGVLARFADALAPVARGRRAAGPHYLHALAHEAAGRALAAEAALDAALAADPGFGSALTEAALYAEERGDAVRAASLLRRGGAPEDDPELARLAAHAPATAKVARNAPCPCGSGRKHKACCLGRPPSLPERAGWLYEKAASFVHRPEQRPDLLALAMRRAFPDGEPDAEGEPEALLRALSDPLLADLALFELGLLEEFLDSREGLLPPDEHELGRRWLDRRRALLEVVAAEPGVGLEVRDTRTGERIWVDERLGSEGREPGELLVGRVVPDGRGHILVGPVLEAPLIQREALLELTAGAEPADADGWLDWLIVAEAPPRLRNTEGEELLFCELRLRVPAAAEARARLAAVLDAEPDGVTFHQHLERDGERWLRASARLEDVELTLTANSAERIERLAALVREALPDAEPLEDRRQTLSEVLEERPGLRDAMPAPDEPTPEMRAAIAEHMAGYALRWIDMALPALGGLTPRQAADDPTRREDLLALLRELERMESAEGTALGMGMPLAPIRAALGLDGG